MRASSISAFQTLKMSVGPSSSHTHGPMLIGNRFREKISKRLDLKAATRLTVELCWSLSRTGKGHLTDNAILAGLLGYDPVHDDLELINSALVTVREKGRIDLGLVELPFSLENDLIWASDKRLAEHENGMVITLWGADGEELYSVNYYSIGGGMVREEGEGEPRIAHQEPYPYKSAAEWMHYAKAEGLKLSDIVLRNTMSLEGWTESETIAHMHKVWQVMKTCVKRGLEPSEAILPGALRVKRRAPRLFKAAKNPKGLSILNKQDITAYATAFAFAVSEENAASGRVVTAPTNGGAGVFPGTLYACQFVHHFQDEDIVHAMFTGAGIGGLIQANASISGSEVGCQGEVGAACAMTAGTVVELYDGTIEDVEYGAEIAMEHSLGLECTPMQGYVQIPCIERNGIFAAKALASAQHAVTLTDHRISLDMVIQKMYENGKHMHTDFKETSRAGFGPHEPDMEYSIEV